jgi:glycosyltransferase involved in cell wall biosynthesis
MPPFTVLMAVYAREQPANLAAALNSIADQTVPPDEILVVKDGPLTPDLDRVLEEFGSRHEELRIIALPMNVGLGKALNAGLAAASNELVARMDSDDISVSQRFERQIGQLADKPELSVIGSFIAEFVSDPAILTGIRAVPVEHAAIRAAFSRISPVNHPSIVYRRSAVLASGGYSPDFVQEDYHLWGKMLAAGYQFANISEPLVLMRTGEGLFARRGGMRYARSEARLQREFLRMGMISPARYVTNLMTRCTVRVLPVGIRKALYELLLRKTPT